MENNPCITIRYLAKEDAKAIADIEEKVFSQPWPCDAFEKAATSNDYMYLVALHDDIVVGYAGAMISLDEADITNVAVIDEYRRLGIAKELLNQLEKQLIKNKITVIFLEVRESNASAISLYEKIGFEKMAMRKNYYKLPTEDAIVMRKSISVAIEENNA